MLNNKGFSSVGFVIFLVGTATIFGTAIAVNYQHKANTSTLNKAKTSALQIYSERLVSNSKEYCILDENCGDINNPLDSEDFGESQYKVALYVENNSVNGCILSDNGVASKITDDEVEVFEETDIGYKTVCNFNNKTLIAK